MAQGLASTLLESHRMSQPMLPSVWDRRGTEEPVSGRHRAIDDIENVRIEMVSPALVGHNVGATLADPPCLGRIQRCYPLGVTMGTEERHPRGEASSPRSPL